MGEGRRVERAAVVGEAAWLLEKRDRVKEARVIWRDLMAEALAAADAVDDRDRPDLTTVFRRFLDYLDREFEQQGRPPELDMVLLAGNDIRDAFPELARSSGAVSQGEETNR